jgi:hypothetical protein
LVALSSRLSLGKTLFGAELGASCAEGVGFLNWKAGRPCRVMYIDGERSGDYAAVRRLYSSKEEQARGGAGFQIEPAYDRQDVPLFGAARLCAVQGSRAAEARAAGSDHRGDSRARLRRRRRSNGIRRSGFSNGCGSNTDLPAAAVWVARPFDSFRDLRNTQHSARSFHRR